MKEDDAVVALLAPSVISPGSSGADTQWLDLELKRCIFCVFRLFWHLCQTASQLYRLSKINALGINQSY